MESCDNGSRAVLKTVVPAMVLGVRISRSPNFKEKIYFTKMEDDCHYLTRLNKCLELSK